MKYQLKLTWLKMCFDICLNIYLVVFIYSHCLFSQICFFFYIFMFGEIVFESWTFFHVFWGESEYFTWNDHIWHFFWILPNIENSRNINGQINLIRMNWLCDILKTSRNYEYKIIRTFATNEILIFIVFQLSVPIVETNTWIPKNLRDSSF